MNQFKFILLIVSCGAGAFSGAGLAESNSDLAAPLELTELRNCATHLKATYAKHQGRIPAVAWEVDRRLKRMSEGVRDNEDNYQMLVDHFSKGTPDMQSRHLIWNATEGCKSFEAKLDAYSNNFFRLTLSILFLCLGLALAPFVYTLDGFSPKRSPTMKRGAEIQSKPSDQPQAQDRKGKKP